MILRRNISPDLLARFCEAAFPAERRKCTGSFYTPMPLAEEIAEQAIRELNCNAEDVPGLRIIDPACGCGVFLVAALKVLKRRFHVLPAAENVCGIELQEMPAEIARIRVQDFYLKYGVRQSMPTIVTADALNCDDVFEGKKFDLLLGNPPFVQICDIPAEQRESLRGKFRFAKGRFNLYELFLELGTRLVRPGGICGWLVPDRLLRNTQSEPLREWLKTEQTLVSAEALPPGLFDDAVIHSIRLVLRCGGGGKTVQRRESSTTMSTISTDAQIQTMMRHSAALGEIARVRDGIIQGAVGDKLFLNEAGGKEPHPLLAGRDIVRNRILGNRLWVDYDPEGMAALEQKRIGGRSPGLRMRTREVFECPKILTRQTADSIIAAYDAEGKYYYGNTLHGSVITDERFEARFVLAVLNSRILNRCYKLMTGETGKPFAQVKIAVLRKLPICRASAEEQAKVIAEKNTFRREKLIRALYGL